MKLEDKLLASTVGPQWSRIGVKHHHGIDVFLPSLHSQNSCGIGEYYDLLPIIDWCAQVGMDVIQLLPLNDTGDDPSPFFAQSAMGLNPLFLSLHKLPDVKAEDLALFASFNTSPRISYHDVQSRKFLFFRQYFARVGETILASKDYEEFLEENSWVRSFALFKALKDIMQKNHWLTWPPELQHPTKESIEELHQTYQKEVSFYIFLQFFCYQQLSFVKSYANSHNVFLKGDIPILVSPDSADVWRYQEEFNLKLLAGAPADEYAKEGQAWGLPTFNWDVMEQKHYDWWKKRLDYASKFYDLYRIDHILGFFRIYAIPEGKSAKEGIYIPHDRADWLPHGKKILSLLCTNTPMLPIGEDLGDVPDTVRDCLAEMGICGTKVIRWEQRKNNEYQFIDPLHYNPISMTTVSTHDSETLTLWWQSQTDEVKAYAHYRGWDYAPELPKARRRQILWDSHHSASLFHINLLGEYLALFPELVWDDPFLERINVPGTVAPFNWTYRVRPSVEQIVNHAPLAEEVKEILA